MVHSTDEDRTGQGHIRVHLFDQGIDGFESLFAPKPGMEVDIEHRPVDVDVDIEEVHLEQPGTTFSEGRANAETGHAVGHDRSSDTNGVYPVGGHCHRLGRRHIGSRESEGAPAGITVKHFPAEAMRATQQAGRLRETAV